MQFDENERRDFVDRWVAVWNTPTGSRDALQFYTEDGEIVDKAIDHTYRGHEELYEYFSYADQILCDFDVSSEQVLIGPSHAVAHLRFETTIKEPFLCLPESSRGKRISLYMMSLLEFADDGRIVRGTDVYDRVPVLQQLGVLPA
ncbi:MULTISPECIES: ester cyclase [unclassified Streptomyces]|uniref:ester cyclase n=1 Tax=unclassified Streptomyces TaxID=2593676 RepID=UPI002E3811B2|nr:ester cyclase [Streptomyces sp. NBC_01268]